MLSALATDHGHTTTMGGPEAALLPPKTPLAARRRLVQLVPSPQLSSVPRLASASPAPPSPASRLSPVSPAWWPYQLDQLDQLLDPGICDSCCSWDSCGAEDTRFLASMAAHQLPSADQPDQEPQLVLASLVAHMVARLIGDEDRCASAGRGRANSHDGQAAAGVHGPGGALRQLGPRPRPRLPALLPQPLRAAAAARHGPRAVAAGDLAGGALRPGPGQPRTLQTQLLLSLHQHQVSNMSTLSILCGGVAGLSNGIFSNNQQSIGNVFIICT